MSQRAQGLLKGFRKQPRLLSFSVTLSFFVGGRKQRAKKTQFSVGRRRFVTNATLKAALLEPGN